MDCSPPTSAHPPLNWLERIRALQPEPPAWVCPERFVARTLPEHLPEGPVRALVARYSHDFLRMGHLGRAPVLLGRSGSFKTTAACILGSLISTVHRVHCKFVSVPDQMLEFEIDRFSATTRALIKKLETLPVVILDDFGVVEPKSFGHRILQAIAIARFDNCRPTIWTGNLSLGHGKEASELAALYGPLLARRILEGGTEYTAYID